MNLKKSFLILVIFIALVSCSNNDDDKSLIQPSSTLIEMEAEGGEADVSFTNGDWYISEVINQSGNMNIHGNTYSPDGELINENSVLSLESQGKMEALWTIKGFVITRDTPSSLKIFLKENSSGEKFNFLLVLKSGQDRKEINVIQKISQGYKFNGIEFSLKEEDSDSLYVKRGTGYKFNIPETQSFEFSPYGGIDVHYQSQFQSSERDAFAWLKNDSIMVEIPKAIYDGELVYNGDKMPYNNMWSINPHGFDNRETVTIPAGKSSFSTELEWRERQISYKLHLINNRTAEEKIIEGKWIEIAPTGKYSIEWQD